MELINYPCYNVRVRSGDNLLIKPLIEGKTMLKERNSDIIETGTFAVSVELLTPIPGPYSARRIGPSQILDCNSSADAEKLADALTQLDRRASVCRVLFDHKHRKVYVPMAELTG